MTRFDELNRRDSCLNRADSTERLFVLMARDKAAPATIRFWIQERLRLGKNRATDNQIQMAEFAAQEMERFQRSSGAHYQEMTNQACDEVRGGSVDMAELRAAKAHY